MWSCITIMLTAASKSSLQCAKAVRLSVQWLMTRLQPQLQMQAGSHLRLGLSRLRTAVASSLVLGLRLWLTDEQVLWQRPAAATKVRLLAALQLMQGIMDYEPHHLLKQC